MLNIFSHLRALGSALLKFCFFFFFACLFTLPGIFHLSDKFMNDGGDLYLFAMDQVHHNLAAGSYPLSYTYDLRYPIGYAFGVGMDALLPVFVGALLLFFFSPAISYNLTLLILLTVNAAVAFWCFRSLFHRSSLAVLGALIYGMSPYVLARGAGHLNLVFVAGFPVLALSLIRLGGPHPRPRDVLLLYSAVVLLFWGSIQYLIMGAICTGLLGVLVLVFNRAYALTFIRSALTQWKWHAVGLVSISAIFLYSFAPTLVAYARGEFLQRPIASHAYYDVDLIHLLLPDGNYTRTLSSLILPKHQQKTIEHAVWIGAVELLVVLSFLLFSKIKGKSVLISLSVVVLIFILGLKEFGVPLPYSLLIHIFPFSAIAEPGRFFAVLSLIIALIVLIQLRQIKHATTRRALTALIFVLVVLERIPVPYFQVSARVSDGYSAMQQLSGVAVLPLPISYHRQDHSFIPIYTDKAVATGYIHWSADTKDSRRFLLDPAPELERFLCRENDPFYAQFADPTQRAKILEKEQSHNAALIRSLKENDIRALAVYKNSTYYHPECQSVRARLGLLLDQHEIASVSSSVTPSVQTTHSGLLGGALFFPQSGTLELHGVALTTATSSAKLALAQTPIELPEALRNNVNEGVVYTLTAGDGRPYDAFRFLVSAGSSLELSTEQVVDLGAVTLWYTFVPSTPTVSTQQPATFMRRYSDEEMDVYEVR